MPQFVGKIHMNLMRVDQTFGFIPQGIQLLLAVLPDLHDLRGVVDALTILEDRNQNFTHGIASGRQMSLLPGLNRVKEKQRIILVKDLIYQANQICDDLAAFLVIDSADGLIARIGYLLGVLG